jgi:hypothetical protein
LAGRRLTDGDASSLETELGKRGGAGLRLTSRGARGSARWRESEFSANPALRGVEISVQVHLFFDFRKGRDFYDL